MLWRQLRWHRQSVGCPDVINPVLVSSQRHVIGNALGQWQTKYMYVTSGAESRCVLAARTARTCSQQSLMCMLNHCLEWDKWVLTNFDHDRQWFNTLIPPSHTRVCNGVFVCHTFGNCDFTQPDSADRRCRLLGKDVTGTQSTARYGGASPCRHL